jgi:hypothetical protein
MPWFINVKKRSLFLLSCLSGGVLGILGLALLSGATKHNSNGFIRLIPPHVAIPQKIHDVGFNSYYLAGGTASRFYLGNFTNPQWVSSLSLELADTNSQRLSMLSAGGRFARSLKITIDSPSIYLYEGVTPSIVQGTLGDSLLHRSTAHFYFNGSAPLSPVSCIYRSIDQHQQNILIKQLNDSFTRVDTIIKGQGDGIFSTEGELHAQPSSNRLVYIYSYRNEFIVTDTNLHVQYKARTIDTISRVKFTVSSIPSENKLTLSSPPTFVNKESCVSGNYLFIHSGLRADNDESSIYDIGSPIDIYSLINGKYLFSFFLPDYQHHKVRDFRVFNNTLIALYDHYAYSYQLNIPVKLRQ